MNYTVGDFIIRIKNATLARRKSVTFPYGRFLKDLGNLLVKEGYLKNIKQSEKEGKNVLIAEIAFDKRMAVFSDVRIISKPSLRVYGDSKRIATREKRELGNIIVSTSEGLMMGKEAVKKGLGGELLFKIW